MILISINGEEHHILIVHIPVIHFRTATIDQLQAKMKPTIVSIGFGNGIERPSVVFHHGKIGRISTGVVHQLVQTLVLQFLPFFRRHFVSFGDEAHRLFVTYCFHFQKY